MQQHLFVLFLLLPDVASGGVALVAYVSIICDVQIGVVEHIHLATASTCARCLVQIAVEKLVCILLASA